MLPHHRQHRDAERLHAPIGWHAWAIVLMLAALVLLCAGCAQVPRCPDAKYRIGMDPDTGERFYIFDQLNWARAMATYRGLAAGACTVPPDGTEV